MARPCHSLWLRICSHTFLMTGNILNPAIIPDRHSSKLFCACSKLQFSGFSSGSCKISSAFKQDYIGGGEAPIYLNCFKIEMMTVWEVGLFTSHIPNSQSIQLPLKRPVSAKVRSFCHLFFHSLTPSWTAAQRNGLHSPILPGGGVNHNSPLLHAFCHHVTWRKYSSK